MGGHSPFVPENLERDLHTSREARLDRSRGVAYSAASSDMEPAKATEVTRVTRRRPPSGRPLLHARPITRAESGTRDQVAPATNPERASPMKRSHWTFLYVPDGEGGVRTVNVDKRKVYAFCSLVGLFLLVVSGVTVSYVRQGHVLRSVHQRDLEIVSLRKTIGSLEDEVSRYQRVMAENRQLQERANLLAGLGPLEDDELNQLFGRGGQAPYEDTGLGLVDEASRDRIRELRTKLDRLMREAQFQRDGFQEVLEVLREDQELRDGTPSIRPIPEGHGYISSRYGRRPDPFTGEPTMHRGLDFSAPVGTPVRAPASGRVKHASRGGSLGLMVELDHSNGLITRYGHLSEILVEKGEWVTRGQIVARVGNTGRSTGPHLHYEVVQNGRSQNPWLYIVRD